MTIMNTDTGEIQVFTVAEAEAVTARLRDAAGSFSTAVDDLQVAVVEAYEGRAWLALGIGSWGEYVEQRVPELAAMRLPIETRQAVVGYLTTEAQMSTRAIGAALGVSDFTARQDIAAGARNLAPDAETSCAGCGNFLADCVCDEIVDAEVVQPPPRTVRGVDGKSYTAPAQRVLDQADAQAMRKVDIGRRIDRLQAVWSDLSGEDFKDFDKGQLAAIRVLAREMVRFVEHQPRS